MVVIKNNPVGIDLAIQQIQEAMYEYLAALWNVNDYQCYGRCYRNQKAEGYVPEVYIGGSNYDYKELYVNDEISALSFFGYERGKLVKQTEAEVSLIFFANLTKLKPTIGHRADEEVRNDVLRFLKDTIGDNVTPINVITGIGNVFSEYSGYRSINSIKNRDLHPFHCFRYNFTLRFNNLSIC